MLLDVWQPKSRLGSLDYFALWIILQNNWGTQKSSNNCLSSSFPLLNIQKICLLTYPHSSYANQLIFMVFGISTLALKVPRWERRRLPCSSWSSICRRSTIHNHWSLVKSGFATWSLNNLSKTWQMIYEQGWILSNKVHDILQFEANLMILDGNGEIWHQIAPFKTLI
jgi:hypothetical protein